MSDTLINDPPVVVPVAKPTVYPTESLADRLVATARSYVGTGEHDPERYAALMGNHKASPAFGVVRGILRECAISTPAMLPAFVEEAKKRGAFVEPKGGEIELMGMRPPAASVLVLALGSAQEHSAFVCSSSTNHIETLEGGDVAHRFGVAVNRATGEKRGTYDRGGPIVEYRSRQWSVEVPRNEQGRQTAAAYIMDGSHHGLVDRDYGVNKRHPARRVAGWVDVVKYAAGAVNGGAA